MGRRDEGRGARIRSRLVAIIVPLVAAVAFAPLACEDTHHPCTTSSECSNGECTPGGYDGRQGTAPSSECTIDRDCTEPGWRTRADAAADADASADATSDSGASADSGEGGAAPPVAVPNIACVTSGQDRYCAPPQPPCTPESCGANRICAGNTCERKPCAADSDCVGFCVSGACSDIQGRCTDRDDPPPP